MKGRILAALCALLMMTASVASANQWGLSGGLIQVVTEDDTWNDYSTITGDLTLNGKQYNVAILGSRYHNVLLVSARENGTDTLLARSDLAVCQPENQQGNVKLKKISETSFAVCCDDVTCTYEIQDHEVVMTSAEVGTLHLELHGYEYDVLIDGEKQDTWGTRMTMDEVNVSLLPTSLVEVRTVKQNAAIMGENFALQREYCEGTESGAMIPVYAAPSEDAWRAANGKAAMSLNDHWYAMGACGDWTIVMYEVSNRTSRVGCVKSSLLGTEAVAAAEEPLNMTATITRNTYVTDDPMVSQYQQKILRAGDTVTLLGKWDNFYAYVSATIDGKEMWGFLPMNSFTVNLGEKNAEAMHQLTGCWEKFFGGPGIGDYVELKEDGTYVASDVGAGQWAVYDADPEWNCFHDHPTLMLVMESSDHQQYAVYGLTVTEGGFCLTDEEDTGSYVSMVDTGVWVN